MDLEVTKAMESIEIQREKMRLAWIIEDSWIMLDDNVEEWTMGMRKDINVCTKMFDLFVLSTMYELSNYLSWIVDLSIACADALKTKVNFTNPIVIPPNNIILATDT